MKISKKEAEIGSFLNNTIASTLYKISTWWSINNLTNEDSLKGKQSHENLPKSIILKWYEFASTKYLCKCRYYQTLIQLAIYVKDLASRRGGGTLYLRGVHSIKHTLYQIQLKGIETPYHLQFRNSFTLLHFFVKAVKIWTPLEPILLAADCCNDWFNATATTTTTVHTSAFRFTTTQALQISKV